MTFLNKDVFHYILLKQTQPNQEGILPFSAELYTTAKERQGGVQWVHVQISERADSKDAFITVMRNLPPTSVFQFRKGGPLLLVSPRYTAFYTLCVERWLLPFPGDWHVLFNYQKLILEAYSDVGLVQPAKSLVTGQRP